MNTIVSNFYLIKVGGEPSYIGYTNRPIKTRFKEHLIDKDFGDELVELESLGSLEYKFTWDYDLITGYAKEVSDRETALIQSYGTSNSIWQKGTSGSIGGQTWANIKYFVRTNRDNPKFRDMSEHGIIEYLATSNKVSRYTGSFISNMDDPVAIYMKNFVNHMDDPVDSYISHFVSTMRDPVDIYINNFAGNMNDPIAVYMSSFVNNMDDPIAVYMKHFVSTMDDPAATYMKNFVHGMDDPVSIYMKNFVGRMNDPVAIYMKNFVYNMDDPVSLYMKHFVSGMDDPVSIYIRSFVDHMGKPNND
jgi:hypothetical protein